LEFFATLTSNSDEMRPASVTLMRVI
jgi:hypothetical protein